MKRKVIAKNLSRKGNGTTKVGEYKVRSGGTTNVKKLLRKEEGK